MRENLEKKIGELKDLSRYVKQQEETLLADAIAFAQSQGIEEMEFDWENNDAPSCAYSGDDDLMDCYITKIKFNKDFPLTCTEVTLHAYYVGEDFDVSLDDINEYDRLDLAEFILNNIED